MMHNLPGPVPAHCHAKKSFIYKLMPAIALLNPFNFSVNCIAEAQKKRINPNIIFSLFAG
jgi:hypothetical protein